MKATSFLQDERLQRELWGLALFALALLLALSFLPPSAVGDGDHSLFADGNIVGKVGAYIKTGAWQVLGLPAFLLPLFPAFWGAVAFALMMSVIISLAARSLAARRREMVTVMCDLGATRSQAAGRIADEAAVLGLYAGLVGGVLAGFAGLIVLWLAIPGLSVDALPALILPVDLAPIVAAPLGAAIAAGFGARAAAGYFHGQAARLG